MLRFRVHVLQEKVHVPDGNTCNANTHTPFAIGGPILKPIAACIATFDFEQGRLCDIQRVLSNQRLTNEISYDVVVQQQRESQKDPRQVVRSAKHTAAHKQKRNHVC